MHVNADTMFESDKCYGCANNKNDTISRMIQCQNIMNLTAIGDQNEQYRRIVNEISAYLQDNCYHNLNVDTKRSNTKIYCTKCNTKF